MSTLAITFPELLIINDQLDPYPSLSKRNERASTK